MTLAAATKWAQEMANKHGIPFRVVLFADGTGEARYFALPHNYVAMRWAFPARGEAKVEAPCAK